MNARQETKASLPVRRNLTPIYALSMIIAILMAAASVIGLLYRAVIYPADDLLQSFVPTDVVNLLVGLPILLGSMWLARRGKLIGLLLWPGVLFFVLYNYIVYVFAVPLNLAFLLHLALLMLSAYTIIGLMVSIDGEAVQQRLTGSVPERVAGGILAGLGLLFSLRVVGVIVSALASRTSITETELGPLVSDFVIAPALVIGGVLLWRRKELGYAAGLGLLFQASMLFIGLIMLLLLQPLLTAAPLVLSDVVVILVLGLICFIPFTLFVRGVVSGRGAAPMMVSKRRVGAQAHAGRIEANVTNRPDPFARDSVGRTALFYAAERGDMEQVRRIIFSLTGTGVLCQRLGAIKIKDSFGLTAADVAERAGHKEIANLLRSEEGRMEFFE